MIPFADVTRLVGFTTPFDVVTGTEAEVELVTIELVVTPLEMVEIASSFGVSGLVTGLITDDIVLDNVVGVEGRGIRESMMRPLDNVDKTPFGSTDRLAAVLIAVIDLNVDVGVVAEVDVIGLEVELRAGNVGPRTIPLDRVNVIPSEFTERLIPAGNRVDAPVEVSRGVVERDPIDELIATSFLAVR